MEFTIPDELIELKERTERFVREEILPREKDPRQTPHGPTEEFRRELVALGRAAGLVSPHVGREWGGLGLDHRGKAIVFEAAGYAPLATIAMTSSRPTKPTCICWSRSPTSGRSRNGCGRWRREIGRASCRERVEGRVG